MKYWPLSIIINSPLLPSVYAVEVQSIYTLQISPYAYHACAEVAARLKPTETNLVIIESLDAPCRFAYSRMPTDEEWNKLERGGVVQDVYGFHRIIMEGLQ